MTPPFPKVAVLVSRYPSASHTFVRREVMALRRQGVLIRTFTVREEDSSQRLSAVDEEERARTAVLFPLGLGRLVVSIGAALVTSPIALLRTTLHASRHRAEGAKNAVRALAHLFEAIVLARFLRREGIDHVHVHFANAAGVVGMLAAQLAGRTFSLTLHGSADLEPPAGALLGRKLARVRFALCASAFVRSQAMLRSSPEHWPRLRLGRCGVELDRIDALRARVPVPDAGAVVFLCVGRLSPEKGQVGLIEAFARVVAEVPGSRLVLVGEGPSRGAIERAIESWQVADRCTLLGQLPEDETLEAIASATLLVSSSLAEGLPVVLMEAMALGVPVIAPRVAGIPELVEDGRSGLLYTPSCFDQLAERMVELASDAELRARLAAEGRRAVELEFTIDRAVVPLLEELRRLGS